MFRNRLTQVLVDTVVMTILTSGVLKRIQIIVRSVDVSITTAYAHMTTWRTKEVMNTTNGEWAKSVMKD